MNPWQIAKDSESSHQIALFCWAAKAQRIGFFLASDERSWTVPNDTWKEEERVPELAWLHHIPNGGSRGDSAKSRAIAGGQLKAEGVKSGVFDLFWPLVRNERIYSGHGSELVSILWAGLYIEMKKPSEKRADRYDAGCSDAQKAFGAYAHSQGYYVCVCYSWQEAAKVLQDYYEGKL